MYSKEIKNPIISPLGISKIMSKLKELINE